MILKKPVREPNNKEGVSELKLVGIEPRYGVEWYGNKNSVDLTFETPNGSLIVQRETFSYHSSSNLGKLIRTILNWSEDSEIEHVETELILNKKLLGDIFHKKCPNGDIYEKVKNFRRIEDSDFQDQTD